MVPWRRGECTFIYVRLKARLCNLHWAKGGETTDIGSPPGSLIGVCIWVYIGVCIGFVQLQLQIGRLQRKSN